MIGDQKIPTVDDEMQVMDFDPEEVQRMDAKTEEEEISRLKAMPALIELQPHEENDYNDITTKMVITWKKRERRKAVGSEEPDWLPGNSAGA